MRKKMFVVNRKWLPTSLIALLSGLFIAFQAGSDVALAQVPATTHIEEILNNLVCGQVVTLSGQIGQHIKGNEYLLDDGAGQIVIDGGPLVSPDRITP